MVFELRRAHQDIGPRHSEATAGSGYFAWLSNMLMQNKTANCKKWQEKPLPVRGNGRQSRIDLNDSLHGRVNRSSLNADL